MKKAFTMIELIFVIMILGIISAIAVPKLAATREDAQVVKISSDIKTLQKDIDTYFAANGEIPERFDFRKITNVPLELNRYIAAYFHNGKVCLMVFAERENLVAFGSDLNDISDLCKKVLFQDGIIRGYDGSNVNVNNLENIKSIQVVDFKNATKSSYGRAVIYKYYE